MALASEWREMLLFRNLLIIRTCQFSAAGSAKITQFILKLLEEPEVGNMKNGFIQRTIAQVKQLH